MNAYNNDANKLSLYSRSTKDSLKELKNYEKRLKKINQVENEFRFEILEYMYTIAYPVVAMRAGGFEVPSITKEKAKNLQKKNPKVQKAVENLYKMALKNVGTADPKKLDAIAKQK